jgi:site-specific recombinase XerD
MAVRTTDGQGWAVPPNKGRTFPPEVLTQEEIRALLTACGRSATGLRNRALLVVLWRAGLRVGEALALRPSDLDSEAGTLRVPHGKTGHRTVGLDPEALALVEQWMTHRHAVLRLNGRRALFCTLGGGPLQPSYVRSLLKRLASRAGVERRVHPHALRHTMAAELLREGASVRHIQLQLGHSDLSTTAAYLESIQPLELVEMARSRPSWNGEASGQSGGG